MQGFERIDSEIADLKEEIKHLQTSIGYLKAQMITTINRVNQLGDSQKEIVDSLLDNIKQGNI